MCTIGVYVRLARGSISSADTCCATFESRCTSTESNETVDDEDEKNERNLLAAPSRRIASAGARRDAAHSLSISSHAGRRSKAVRN